MDAKYKNRDKVNSNHLSSELCREYKLLGSICLLMADILHSNRVLITQL
jgi:hypothetical protein